MQVAQGRRGSPSVWLEQEGDVAVGVLRHAPGRRALPATTCLPACPTGAGRGDQALAAKLGVAGQQAGRQAGPGPPGGPIRRPGPPEKGCAHCGRAASGRPRSGTKAVGHFRHVRPPVVHEQQVEVAAGRQVATPEAADGQRGRAPFLARWPWPDLGWRRDRRASEPAAALARVLTGAGHRPVERTDNQSSTRSRAARLQSRPRRLPSAHRRCPADAQLRQARWPLYGPGVCHFTHRTPGGPPRTTRCYWAVLSAIAPEPRCQARGAGDGTADGGP